MKFYLCLCVTLTLAYQSFAQIVVQSTESTLNSTENPVILNTEFLTSTENTPVSTPENARPECPANMRPWELSESNKTVWKCFCQSPFLSFPMNNTCVKAFRQGPCSPGNIVVQPRPINRVRQEPRCIPNTCHEDGLVFFNGTCRDITIDRLCNRGLLYYNETASEITCKFFVMRTISALRAPKRRLCPPDSRPDKNGICRRKM